MAFKFNPITGKLDIVGTGGTGPAFDPDTILTGPASVLLYSGPDAPLVVLVDGDGNVLVGE